MSTTLTIESFCEATYNLLHVNIEAYRSEVIFAADQITPIGIRVQISGSAMLSATDWANLRGQLINASGKINSATLGVGGVDLISILRSKSLKGAPTCSLNGNAVHGTGLAIIHFDIQDETIDCNQPVVAHTWTQEMRLDGAGRLTRTVHGQIQANRTSTNSDYTPATTPTTWGSTGPFADLFRRAFIPQPPSEGWRRESQQFAYDQTSTILMYQFVDVQHAYDLPDGVRVGDMEFSIERTAREAGIANATFTCDLEGDLSLKQLDMAGGVTGNRLLVTAAVALSKTRINANYSQVIITRLRITESELLTKHKIRFELDAQVVASSTIATSSVSPLMTMIGQKFSVKRSLARAVDPYGAYTVNTTVSGGIPSQVGNPYTYWMVPHYIGNIINGQCCSGENEATVPTMTVQTGSNAYGTIEVGVLESDIPSSVYAEFNGKLSVKQFQPNADSDGYLQIVAHSIAHASVDTRGGMVVLSTAYQTGADIAFQTRKPRIRVTERVEIAKANAAPAKAFRPMPVGAVIVDERWDVTATRNDGQGQGMYTAAFERTYELYDTGGTTTANGFLNDTFVRAWGAPSGYVAGTLSSVLTTGSQETGVSIFGPFTGASPATGIVGSERYTVPVSDWIS